jgi:paraquat-inducible protein A
MTQGSQLIACHECDLLQRRIVLPPNTTVCCRRCGAVLYGQTPDSIQPGLACAIAAVMLFILANLFPIVGLSVQGERHDTTLYSAVQALWDQNMEAVAVLVAVTTILMPALDLGILIYIMLALHPWGTPHRPSPMVRTLQSIRPWAMVEVFMLGLLVSLVKLMHFATVIPGIALWAFGGFILVRIFATEAFNPRYVWERVGGVR